LIKRYISFIIALLCAVCLCGCIEYVDDEQVEPGEAIAEKDSGLGLVNPLKEMSREELVEATGIDLGAPENAEELVYSLISLEDSAPIAQLKFKLDGEELCYRAQSMAGQNAADISGMYYQWEIEKHVFVNMNYAVVYCSGDAGYIKWIDAAPGIQYSLSMNEGADKDKLIELAEAVFAPVQADVG